MAGPHEPDETLAQTHDVSLQAEREGEVIGRYKLLQQIGEGGFGTVWMAEQREPVKRRVALKIIKLGMDTKQVVARFEAERQALAMMDHPNIAKVLDAGATETGRPYFVMELVRGVPILEYCDTEKVDTCGRLILFTKACHAIQHAHQKGIIHRDIKPSNVLVTMHDGVPMPKVIDFGIAKATNTELTQKTLFTEHRQMIGTPAYMSPEQAEMSGLDIDTRSDIYSLGVLLYELLTGTTPFDSKSLLERGFAEMMRVIREEMPHRPSTRLSTLGDHATRTAQQRRADPQKLSVLLRGDLDWIAMKCLEKDRTRRYETASGLADDIERHLNDEPVEASPPSVRYRTGKFLRRHRVGVGVTGAIGVMLILAVVVSVWFAAEASRQRVAAQEALAREEARAEELDQVAEFQAEMLRSVDLTEMGKGMRDAVLASTPSDRESAAIEALRETDFIDAARLLFARQFIEASRQRIEREFRDLPALRARLLESLARLASIMDAFEDAESLLDDAMDAHRAIGGLARDNTSDWSIRYTRANHAKRVTGEWDPELYASLYKAAVSREGADHPRVHQVRIEWLLSRLNTGDARALGEFDLGLDQAERVFGADSDITKRYLANLAWAYQTTGDPAEASERFEELIDRCSSSSRSDRSFRAYASEQLGWIAYRAGRYKEALASFERASELRELVNGRSHTRTLRAMSWIGLALRSLYWHGEPDAYMPYLPTLRHIYETRSGVLGASHAQTLDAQIDLGIALRISGRFDEAERMFRDVMEITARSGEDAEVWTLWAAHELSLVCNDTGRLEEAIGLARDVVEEGSRRFGPSHWVTKNATQMLAVYLRHAGRAGEAIEVLEAAIERCAREGAEASATLLEYQEGLAIELRAVGDSQRALDLLREVASEREEVLGEHHPLTLRTLYDIGRSLRDMKRHDEAEPVWRSAYALHRRHMGERNLKTVRCAFALGRCLNSLDRPDEAVPLLRDSLEARTELLGESDLDTVWSMVHLGVSHRMLGEHDRAEPLFARALQIRTETLGSDHPDTVNSVYDLARARLELGDGAGAEALLLEGLESAERVFGVTHRTTRWMRERLIELLVTNEDGEAIERLHSRCDEITRVLLADPVPDAQTLNDWAWWLLTADPVRFRDAEHALPLALRANELVAGTDPNVLDTLALAEFENGNGNEALQLQIMALSMVEPQFALESGMTARLERYKAGIMTEP